MQASSKVIIIICCRCRFLLRITIIIISLQYISTLQPPGGCEDITTMSQEDLIDWKQVHELFSYV